jgi:acyl dehydratase
LSVLIEGGFNKNIEFEFKIEFTEISGQYLHGNFDVMTSEAIDFDCQESFEQAIHAYVGQEVAPRTRGLDPVNATMIRHWCEVMGDTNPVYTDEVLARDSVKGGLIAPPSMLQVWSMEGYPMAFDALEGTPLDLQKELHDVFNRGGYPSVVGTNCIQTYERDLRPGDEVYFRTVIDSISEQKTTALGTGYFIETKTEFTDAQGGAVGSMIFRVLKFRPHGQSEGAAAPVSAPVDVAAVAIAAEPQGLKRLDFGSVGVGDQLPSFEIPVTAGLIVGGAVASRDFTPVHHNKAAAEAQGMQDVFMNILTSGGLLGRYVSDWAGSEARVKSMNLKLGAPNFPGFTMTVSGEVTELDATTGELSLKVVGKNAWGMHAQANMVLELPVA